jgi:AcrR family transcriptional regulator
MYQRRSPPGFGKPNASDSTERGSRSKPAGKAVDKPLKRPAQARAKFTVQAIYDAFVRIWRDRGWSGVTTRAVALETGISVGTFYDYFPNKQALLSGYVRHSVDVLLDAIELQVVQAPGLTWQERVHRLVRLTCGIEVAELPYFDANMLGLETQIAEPKHHRRVYEEMSAKWLSAFDACTDLPCRPNPDTVRALYLSIWGARRYWLLVDPQDISPREWAAEMERLCCAALEK